MSIPEHLSVMAWTLDLLFGLVLAATKYPRQVFSSETWQLACKIGR